MMQYLVLETHPAYAVLLDEEGRFLKAANLHYTVGDRVTEIVELQPVPNGNAGRWKKSLASLSALAACLCLVFFGYYQPNFSPYGTLRLQINPDVTLTLSENDRVVGLAGGNQDGWDLIEGYDYHGKDRDTATDELVDRAIEMGYLSDGDTISVTVSSEDTRWQQEEETQISQHLESKYGQTVIISLGPKETVLEEDVEVTIPVSPAPTDGDSGYHAQTMEPEPLAEPPGNHSPSAHLHRTTGDSHYDSNGNSSYDNASGNSNYDDSGASDYRESDSSGYQPEGGNDSSYDEPRSGDTEGEEKP